MKCLEQPVSAIPLEAGVGAKENRLDANRFELFLLVPCKYQGLLAVEPPMISVALAAF